MHACVYGVHMEVREQLPVTSALPPYLSPWEWTQVIRLNDRKFYQNRNFKKEILAAFQRPCGNNRATFSLILCMQRQEIVPSEILKVTLNRYAIYKYKDTQTQRAIPVNHPVHRTLSSSFLSKCQACWYIPVTPACKRGWSRACHEFSPGYILS